MRIEKIVNKDTDPASLDRPLSKAVYWHSKGWNRELPTSVRLSTNTLHTLNRTLDPEAIEEASRGVLKMLCTHAGMKATVDISGHLMRKRQLGGFIVYADDICDRASEALLRNRAKSPCLEETAASIQGVLRELDAMLAEQDEPDFLHRPTEHAYGLARQVIESSYTHYVGSPPVPVIAPDGEGGLIAEWKSGQRVVRLIISASPAGKSYLYSKEPNRSLVEYSVTGLILSQQLSAVFIG